MFPDVLVIGLAHRREWQDHLINSLYSAGFTNVSVMEAVDWRDLSESPPWQVGSLPPVYPYPDWCNSYTRRALTLGQVGCALSHILAWHRVVESGRPTLILEEDAVLVEDLVDQIPTVLEDLAHVDYSVCYFYHHYYPRDAVRICPLVGRLIYHISDYCPVSALAYMISPLGARRLLSSPWQDHLVPSDVLLPAVLGLYYDEKSINRFFTSPDVASTSLSHVVSTHQLFFTVRPESWSRSETEKSPGILERRDSFLALTVSSAETEDVGRLCRSARRYGFAFEVLGLGSGDGDGWKLDMLRSRLADVPSDVVVLCVDGDGVIVNGYVNNIIILWRDYLGAKILFAASKVCLDAGYEDLYPSSDNAYRFLNSAMFMGTAGDLRHLLSVEIADDVDMQRHFATLFLGLHEGRRDGAQENGGDVSVLQQKMAIDFRCRILQSIDGAFDDVSADIDAGRLRNNVIPSWPHVVHAGGSIARDWLNGDGRAVGGRHSAGYGDMESGIIKMR